MDDEIDGFLERTVTPIGTSGKADVPRKCPGRRVYIVITKSTAADREEDVKQYRERGFNH